MSIPTISKSRFVSYMDCPKLGYMLSYPARFKHLADPMDWLALHLTGEGIRVGELARLRFPAGVLIGHVWDVKRAVADTGTALRDDRAGHVFEAAFTVDDPAGGLLCRVDVLRKVEDGRVDLIEVKATNGVKTEHIFDVAFQLAVVEAAGLPVRSVYLAHFDPDYVCPGGDRYDLDSLFVVEDVTERARQWSEDDLQSCLERMRSDVALPDPPSAPLKNSCKQCRYYRQGCSVGAPLHPVCELGGRGSLGSALAASGIQDLREVPDGFPGLEPAQEFVLDAVRVGGLVCDREAIRSLLADLVFPLWFLDFETYMPGLPIYEGMRPWQQIPFQWSLHILGEDGSLSHHEFLKADATDPRRAFAESLLATVGDTGSIVVYNKGMESTRLRELARDLPDLAEGLLALDDRVFDLLPVVRRGCYHPDFHGSRSLKTVTPVLAPQLSYEALSLAQGLQAMEAYETITDPGTPPEEQERLRADLLTYCSLDTLAMVEVLRRLWAEARQV